jgi:glycosyltransferase involved in cell wall biosynthesis
MRIGVDATCWQNTRGYGRHARALLGALVRLDTQNQYVFVVDSADEAAPLPPEVEVRRSNARRPAAIAASAEGNRAPGDLWRMSRALSAADFDLLLFPTVYSYVPVLSRAKKIVFIHDVIAETYPRLTLPRWSARLFWKMKVALGRWQSDALVTVSEFSRRGILDSFRHDPARVFVIGEASDPVFRLLDRPALLLRMARLADLGVEPTRRNVVYVGGFGPHKNLDALVTAFATLANQPALADVRLVLVGECGKEIFHSSAGEIRRHVDALGIADRVLFTGFVPDEDLVALLNLATVLVLPSLIEGFGLPAIEAAACGCPVIATTASPLPDLLGEGGLFIDPRNQTELETALTRVLAAPELRRQMRAAGLAAAARLTWDAAARQMMDVIRIVSKQ